MTSLLHPVFAGPVREPSSVTRLVSGGPPATIAPRRPRADLGPYDRTWRCLDYSHHNGADWGQPVGEELIGAGQ